MNYKHFTSKAFAKPMEEFEKNHAYWVQTNSGLCILPAYMIEDTADWYPIINKTMEDSVQHLTELSNKKYI